MAFDAGSIEAHLTISRDEFDRALDQAKADADKFAGREIKAKITADAAQASAEFDKAQAKADKLSGQDVTVKVRADTGDANTDLDKTAAKADALGKRTETIKVKTETDTSGLDKLGQKIAELKDGPFGLLKTAIVGLGPAAIPVLGGITAAIAPLYAAIGSAAVGLEGFGQISKQILTQSFTAATAVQKAQGAYNASIAAGTKQATAYKTEQLAIAKAYAGMSSQQVSLAKSAGNLETGWKNVLKSVTPLVSSALVPWMKDVQSLLQYIKPLIAPVATDFQAWGTELGKALSGNQGKIRDFISLFGARSAGNIASFGSALISFAKGAASLIHDVAPGLGGAANSVAELAASFAKWAASKSAADDIKSFFSWARSTAPEVKQFLTSLAGSVTNLIKAASYSGGGDLRVLITALSAIGALPPGAIVALADAYVAVSLGLRAASIAMAAWNAISAVSTGIQAALGKEVEATGAALVIQKIAALAMAAADAVVDAAETIYIGLMLAADAASLPLIAVIGAIVVAVAALGVGIYELVTHWTTVWHAILSAAQAVLGWIKANWPLLVGILGGPIGVAIALIATHWHTALSDAQKIWADIKSFFTGWWNDEVSDWKSTLATVTGVFRSAWNTVSSDARSVWNAIKSWFTGWWNDEVSGWKTIISTVTGLFRGAWNTVKSDAQSVWNAIRSWFSGFWSDEVQGWRTIISTVESVFRNGWNTVESDAKRIFNSVMSFFKGFWADLKSGFSSAVTGVKTAWDKLESIVRTPVTWVVKNVYDKLIVPFWNATGGAVGLPKLKALAEGGIVPGGYSRTDNQLAWVRSGEGVLQPGAVSALGGPGFIHWANRTYGDVPVSAGDGAHFASGGTVGKSSGSGGWWNDVTGAFTDAWDAGLHIGGDVLKILSKITDVRQWLKLPLEGVEKVIDGLLNAVPGKGGMATYAKDAGKKIVSTWISKLIGATTGSGYAKGVSVAGNVIQWLTQALRDTNSPLSWLSGEEIIAKYESGGNPNAINLSDSNAAAGDPSRGLMQTIMATFDAYHQAGTSWDIYNPVANAAASINYQKARYGSVWNVPGVVSVEHGGGYVGYDSGGWLAPGATFVNNTSGRPEPVLSADQWDMLGAVTGGGGLGDKLDRIANLLAAGPRATAAGVGEVVNGSAHNASFRSRYPRNR